MTRGLKSGGGPDREGGEADAASVGTEVSSPGLAGVGCPTTLEAIDRGQGQAWRGEVCDPDACDISESVFDTGILDDLASELDLGELEAARVGGPLSRTARQAIGVAELGAVLDGQMSLDEAARHMKTRTRTLVRRQLTWLRKIPGATLVSVAGRPPAAVAARVLGLLE